MQLVEMDFEAVVANTGDATARKLCKAVVEFHTYIENNKGFSANDSERYRHGERISTGCVESTVNQVVSQRFCKKQPRPRTKRAAPLRLHMQVQALNHAFATVFCRWYPDFPIQQGEAQAA